LTDMIEAAGQALGAGAIEAAQGPVLNTAKIHLLELALLSAVVLSLAITAAVRGHAGKFARVLEMFAVVLAAALVAGLASGQNFERLGSELFSTFFG